MILALAFLFASLYSGFLLWCLNYWMKAKRAGTAGTGPPVAIIVPVRNEEKNIVALLNDLSKQSYSPFEIIVSDDHSTDNTLTLVNDWITKHKNVRARCISSHAPSKKSAISEAINLTDAEIIITTDADCRMEREWISALAGCMVRNEAVMVSGPVALSPLRNFSDRIQAAEFAGLTAMSAAGIVAGAPMFCSGANLAFRKDKFFEVKGYENSRSHSGDDTQLLRKFASLWRNKIFYLKDHQAVVSTATASGLLNSFSQRKRWASKIPATLSGFTVTIAILAWITHLLLLTGIIISFRQDSYALILFSWALVFIFEAMLIGSVMNFFRQRPPYLIILLSQPFYAIYIVIIGLIAPFSRSTWKGRKAR